MLFASLLLAVLAHELVLCEPVAGHNTAPYYKKQGIEKFLDEDDRLRKHCISLIESGVEVDDLEPECQAIYYKEEYEDNEHRHNGSNQIEISRTIIFTLFAPIIFAFYSF